MTRLVLALAIVGMAAADRQSPAPRREAGQRLQIDFVALDGRDNPVTDLRPEDLEVRIE